VFLGKQTAGQTGQEVMMSGFDYFVDRMQDAKSVLAVGVLTGEHG
jgi:hypothetical protein